MPQKNNNHGGKRPGAGAPKKIPTTTMSIRHDEKVVAAVKKKYNKHELSKKGKDFLNRLAKDK